MIKILVLGMFSVVAAAGPQITFKETFTRYLSGHDLMRMLGQKFPKAGWEKNVECSRLTENNRAALGDPNPANGELSYRSPSTAYLRWYIKCLTPGIENDFNAMAESPSSLEPLYGKEVIQMVQGKPFEKMLKDPKGVKWSEVPENVRVALAGQFIDRYVGPGIVKISSGLVGQLLPAVADSTNVLEAMKKTALYIAIQEEFLTY